jgi:transcriptional regulator with XRE-family HTH domain
MMTAKQKRLLGREYDSFLDQIVDELFELATAADMTWSDFAKRSGLAPATVYRLGNRTTRAPQLRTIWKLARAVGREVEIRGRVRRRLRVAA